MKWRAIELYLVAGENGNDGLLPPVERLAWHLRLPREKLEETLSALSQAGVVHACTCGTGAGETPQGRVVTDFVKSQAALTSKERLQNMRRRKEDVTIRYKNGNENVTAVVDDSTSSSSSTSCSFSFSESLEEERVQGEEKPRLEARLSPPLLPACASPAPTACAGRCAAGTGANLPTGPDPSVDVFRVYQPNLRLLAPVLAEALRDAERSDGAESAQVTVTSKVTVTSRWRRDGFRHGSRLAETCSWEGLGGLPAPAIIGRPFFFRAPRNGHGSLPSPNPQDLGRGQGRGRAWGIRFFFDTRNEYLHCLHRLLCPDHLIA